jgi:hypothetical protein
MNRLREDVAKADDEMRGLEAAIDVYVNGEKERQMKVLKAEERK